MLAQLQPAAPQQLFERLAGGVLTGKCRCLQAFGMAGGKNDLDAGVPGNGIDRFGQRFAGQVEFMGDISVYGAGEEETCGEYGQAGG